MRSRVISVSNEDRYNKMKSINDCGYLSILKTKNGNCIIQFEYDNSNMIMYSSKINSYVEDNGIHKFETQNNTYIFEELK